MYEMALKKLLLSLVDERYHNRLRKNIADGLSLLGEDVSLEERIAIDDSLDTLGVRMLAQRVLTGDVSVYHVKMDVQSPDGDVQTVRVISTDDPVISEFIDGYISAEPTVDKESEFDEATDDERSDDDEEVDPYSIN